MLRSFIDTLSGLSPIIGRARTFKCFVQRLALFFGQNPPQLKFLALLHKLETLKHQQGIDHYAGILVGNRTREDE